MDVRSFAHARDGVLVEDPVLARALGRYDAFRDNEPDFTASDLISLALLSKSENSRLKFYKNYYERAFNAVASGLGVPNRETLMSAVRKFALSARDQAPDWHTCFVLRAKLQQLTELHAHTAVTGSAAGEPAEQPAAALSPAAQATLDWYLQEMNRAAEGVLRIDATICGMLGWDPTRHVGLDLLQKKHNFPDRAQLRTFFRPTGLQDTYKAYEGVPTVRG